MPTRHIALAVVVAVVWGFNFVVTHAGLASFPPLLFATLRFVLMAFPAIFLVGRPRVPWRWVVGTGVFLGAGQFGLMFVAMDQGMPAGLASLVVQLQVVFTIALAMVFLHERPRPIQLAGAAVSLAGIVLIAGGRAESVPLVAVALAIGSAACWGAGNICVREARPPDAIALLVWSSLIPPLPLMALSLAFEGPGEIGHALAHVSLGGVLALLFGVIASTAFGYGAWTWLLSRHAASKVAPFALLVPIVGIATAWVAIDEVPTVAEIAGALIVLAGLALATSGLRVPVRRRPGTELSSAEA